MNIFDWSTWGKTKEESELREKYRNAFAGPDGPEVLTDLLIRLHFFDEIASDEEKVLRNFSLSLLQILGIWEAKNARMIVESFLDMSVRHEIDRG